MNSMLLNPDIADRPNIAEINLGNIEMNYALLRRIVGNDVEVIASIKGGAYGFGVVAVAKALCDVGVDFFSTGSLADVKELRNAGFHGDIVMFGGALPDSMPRLIAYGAIPTAHNLSVAEAVSRSACSSYPVFVKIDVGFGRLGVPIDQGLDFVKRVASLPRVEVRGIYTHIPFSDRNSLGWARERLAAFDDFLKSVLSSGIEVRFTQARASACILANLKDSCNAVNPGGLLYGRSPLAPEISPFEHELRPVLRAVRSRLIHISPRASDVTVQFPSRHARQVSGATGVVPFGRSDGNRAAVEGRLSQMLVRGRPAKVLSVSSEHCVIDLSSIPDAAIGDEVTIIGSDGEASISLATVASGQATNESDILLALRERLHRSYV